MAANRRYESVFHAIPLPAILIHAKCPNFSVSDANNAYTKLTGRSEKELIGQPLFKAFPDNPLDRNANGVAVFTNLFKEVIETGEANSVQGQRFDIFKKESGEFEEHYYQTTQSPLFDESGEVEYILQVIQDVTDKVHRDRECELLFNDTETSFVLVDLDLNIINFNREFHRLHKELFDLEAEQNRPVLDFARPERREISKSYFERVFNGEVIEEQLKVQEESGDTRHFEVRYKPAVDSKGRIYGATVSQRENSAEIHAEKKLRKNEARFRALVEKGSDVLFILSAKGDIYYVSPSVENVLGYTQAETMELDIMQSVHPDDIEHVQKELEECLASPGIPIEVTPARMRHKDGSWRWFDGSITNMLHDPDINGIVDNFKEITEQVETERKLNRAKEQYQSLIQTVDGIFWEAYADTFEFTYVSPQVKEILGYTPKEWLSTPGFWKDHIHPEDRQSAVKYCQTETLNQRNHDFEYRMKTAEGRYIWLKDVVTVISAEGKPVKLRGLLLDITERKLEEQIKIEEREKYRSIFENSLVALFVTKPNGTILEANPAACDLFGYTLEEIRQLGRQGIIDPESPGLHAKLTQKLTAGSSTGELCGIHKNGKRIPCEFSSAIFKDSQGEILITDMIVDVTDRKYYEKSLLSANEQLKRTVDRYEIVSKATSDTIWDFDLAADSMVYNDNIYTMFGYKKNEVSSSAQWWRDKIHPDDQLYISQELRNAITYKKNRFQLEYRFRAADGSYKNIYDRAFLLKNENGDPERMIGAMQDMTDMMAEQEQLKLLESAITNTNESVVITEAEPSDLPGRKILYLNQAFTEMTGYSREEVLGTTLHFLNGPKTDPKKRRQLKEAMKQYRVSDVEMINYKKNEEAFWLHTSCVPVENRDGTFTHWVFIGRDISEQKKQEEEVLTSLKEKETLLAEIHHRVKNNLAVVSSLMEIQAMNSEDPELNNQLMSGVMRIKSMATIHEQLYQSHSFSKLQFSGGLKKLVHSIVNTLKKNLEIDLEFDLEDVQLSINQGLPCSLLVNEILTNILKHSFSGRKSGTIKLRLNQQNERITLGIEDDGNGLPDNFDQIDKGSMGLQLINVLTQQLNGQKSYHSDENGTTFTLSFVLNDAKGSGSSFLQ